jgi:4-diphosphocytidyl-2C-methyl-D-erythritol kinase
MLAAGAVYTAMSGSGSAVFGLFSEKPELPAAYVGEVAW